MPSRADSKGEQMCSGLAWRLTDVHTIDDWHGLTEKASAPCRHAATSATLPTIQLFMTILERDSLLGKGAAMKTRTKKGSRHSF